MPTSATVSEISNLDSWCPAQSRFKVGWAGFFAAQLGNVLRETQAVVPLMKKDGERHSLCCVALHRCPTCQRVWFVDFRLNCPCGWYAEQFAAHAFVNDE